MGKRLVTPSKVTAWLECPHYLTLDSQVVAGILARPYTGGGSFAELLRAKGDHHEQACLAALIGAGKRVREITPRDEGETFADWVKRVGDPFDDEGWDILFQMPFMQDGMRGTADFIERVINPATGASGFEPIDSKLVRTEAKPGHVLQLCFYADGIEDLTGAAPEQMIIWLGSGHPESLRINEFRPYWRRLRQRLAAALEAGPTANTVPEPCKHCQFCEFNTVCDQQWRDEDSLVFVGTIRPPERVALTEAGVGTLTALAAAIPPVDGIQAERITWLIRQARLQLQAGRQHGMPFEILDAPDAVDDAGEDVVDHRLPEPDGGDVFIDFEGHPFWTAEHGLFFLFGLLEFGEDGQWHYVECWAHTKEGERAAAADFIDYLAQRRQRFPNMHVYHYNHTERTSLEALAEGNATAESQIKNLVDTGAFVDLYRVALKSFQIGAESYGLKYVEKLTSFVRSHAIDKGAGAVLQYEQYMHSGDPADLVAIKDYNEDDVRATRAVRDWMITHRPAGIEWRPAVLEPKFSDSELEAKAIALRATGDPVKYFFGEVLGYWLREWRANMAPRLAKLSDPDADLLKDPEVITGLMPVGLIDRFGKNGAPLKHPGYRFTFPKQELEKLESDAKTVMCIGPDKGRLYYRYENLNPGASRIDLVWDKKAQQSGFLPSSVVIYDWVDATDQSKALVDIADRLLEGRAVHPVTMALLTKAQPQFLGEEPADGIFTDELAEMKGWVTQLDNSFVAIQGPPGAGKTYTAARLIHTLICARKRVGICAVSHAAIDNLLDEVLDVFSKEGDLDLLTVARKGGKAPKRTRVTKPGTNQLCAQEKFNIIAGTTWLFASPPMLSSPLDVLIVDEAGQLSLADALAASLAAHNLLLVGDPLQLAQVSQANHPSDSGISVLDHVLNRAPTIPDDRGVFLAESWRMHSDICSFISELIYQNRLESHRVCEQQTTVAGTGLRWLRAHHEGNSTSSPEEADLIADEIRRLIGTDWTDQRGNTQPLTPKDFMVVAPYNRQRRAIRNRLSRYPEIAGVPVGTVDKFQGQEAAVVFFSMATSSGEYIVRGKDFLFSRNRLNVAISRARCLAYLVCTEELLNTRANNVEEMRLISTLNAFAEWAAR